MGLRGCLKLIKINFHLFTSIIKSRKLGFLTQSPVIQAVEKPTPKSQWQISKKWMKSGMS